MFRNLPPSIPSALGKWCAYALVLLAPGSFIALPVLWLVRHLAFAPRQQEKATAMGSRKTRDL